MRVPCRWTGWCWTVAAGLLVSGAARAADLDVRWLAGGHRTSVDGVALSADAALAASAGNDTTVKLWRTADGALLRTFTQPGGHPLHTVIFAPDEESLVAAGTGGAYRWRISDGALLATYCCMETGYDLAFSPDGALLAVGGSISGLDADVVLFDAASGEELAEMVGADLQYVFAVEFAPDGSTVLAAEGNPFNSPVPAGIRYWDVATRTSTRLLTGHASRVRSLALSPDGATIYSGGQDQTIRLWDYATGAPLATWPGHSGEVAGLALTADGGTLVSGSADKSLRMWNTATGNTVRTLLGHGNEIAGVAVADDGSRIVSSGGRVFSSVNDASVRMWDATNGAPLQVFTQFAQTLEALALAPDGARVAVAGGTGKIQIRSAADGAVIRDIPLTPYVQSLAFSPDGERIAAACTDKIVRVWNIATGAQVLTLTGHTKFMYSVLYSPDGALIASGAYDEPVRLWNAATGALVRLLDAPAPGVRAMAFSPDGGLLLTARDATARLWDVATGAIVRTVPHDPGTLIQVVAYAPGGGLFATSSSTQIRLWNASTGALAHTLNGHTGAVRTLAFSPNGAVLASGCEVNDRAARFWSVADGAPLAAYDGGTGTGPQRIAIGPDDRQLFILRQDTTLLAARNPLGPPLGDADGSGSFDAADAIELADCLAGPELAPAPPLPATTQSCRLIFDADNDGDVDLADVGRITAGGE